MNAGELLDLFRADTADDTEPYLWSDTEIFAYMNDAYSMFVRLTGGISDSTSSVTYVPVVTGLATSPLNRAVLRIHKAFLESSNYAVRVINTQDVENLTDEDYGVIRRLNHITTRGDVQYMITGKDEGSVQWVQVPAADDTVRIVCERLPLDTISEREDEFTDVGPEHHLHFLPWMRFWAYRKQDADTFDMVKSDKERADFEAYCRFALSEKERRRHKVRVVRYGGI